MALFPPDTLCYVLARNMSQVIDCDNSSVTPGMINYLNLTTSIDSYIQGYCLNPQPDDSCPFGFCPQPDIVGIFVRISNYITTLCLSVLLIFGTKQEDITTAFSSSLLNTLSLLITSGITIIQGNFSRFHAWLAFYLATPPLQLVLFGYSLASFLGFRGHRLERSVGAGKVVQRTLVVLGMLASVALLIYVLVPDTATHFAQESCEATSFFLQHKYFIALNLVVTGVKVSRFWLIIALVPFVIQIITVIVVIWRGDFKDEDFVSDFRRKHSLMFFFNVVVGPYVWWVGTIESVLRESPSDSTFSPSFGQILALFVAIPPLISVLHFSRLNWQGSEDSKYDAPQPYVQGSDSQLSLAPAQGRQSQPDGYHHYNY